MEKGFVYILTNPSFREDWVKIGKSKRPVDVRSKELDNTAVPLPFEIYATIETTKYHEVEKNVHKMIDRLTDLRIRQNREFFNVEPSVALSILKEIATLLDDAIVYEYIDGITALIAKHLIISPKMGFYYCAKLLNMGEIWCLLVGLGAKISKFSANFQSDLWQNLAFA